MTFQRVRLNAKFKFKVTDSAVMFQEQYVKLEVILVRDFNFRLMNDRDGFFRMNLSQLQLRNQKGFLVKMSALVFILIKHMSCMYNENLADPLRGGGGNSSASYLLLNAPTETFHASICVQVNFVGLPNSMEANINRSIGSD